MHLCIKRQGDVAHCNVSLKETIRLAQTELLVEAADTSAGVHHLLLTGVEGVTLGADFHLNVLLSRTSLDHVAAGASNSGLLIVGMDAFLHGIHLFLSKISPGAQ